MSGKPVTLRKHAIFKHHYRRAAGSAADFHSLDAAARWALLRTQVEADRSSERGTLLAIFESRNSRRDEVLAALEEGRQTHVK